MASPYTETYKCLEDSTKPDEPSFNKLPITISEFFETPHSPSGVIRNTNEIFETRVSIKIKALLNL